MRSLIYQSVGGNVSITINPDLRVKLVKLPLPGLTSTWRDGLSNLAGFRLGRIVLHLLCYVRTGHLLWHWRGVLRELHFGAG
ncbi:MAG: hypothetical protein H7Y43_07625 [Akkermansiaceae bacterium]|nr:hypothetical protein [Verrucomicrobiales bacterium]